MARFSRSRVGNAMLVAALAFFSLSVAPSGAIGGFGDVGADEFYSDAVQWMVDEDLTTGTSPGCFSPDQALSRAEFATFLWRFDGSRRGAEHPFTDVAATSFYGEAVAWLYGAGITTGTSPTAFSPNRTVTRGETATFLWRYDGSRSAPAQNFSDVPEGTYYEDAVNWMAQRGITTGTTPTTFEPDRALTRAEFATFLYRYAGAPAVSHSASGTCGGSGGDTSGGGDASGGDDGSGGSAGGGGDLGDGIVSPSEPLGTELFFEDFVNGDWEERMEHDIFHRDDHLVSQTEWVGDHEIIGPNDLCGPPEDRRVIQRGDREDGFNEDWIYRCVPGGDLEKAHMMTSIGDTSGYSIGAITPMQTFTDVTEVRWEVNQTDLGDRQFTELAIIPAENFSFERLPCQVGLPCGNDSGNVIGVNDDDTINHHEIGSVGTQWGGQRVRIILTPDQPGGYTQAGGDLGYRCDGCPYAPGKRFGVSYGENDPALTSIRIRRENYFRDNGDGTLTWGFELESGNFQEFTVPGSFPDGEVRVVWKDHGYTPLKSPADLLPETTFTWHWDNFAVYGG